MEKGDVVSAKINFDMSQKTMDSVLMEEQRCTGGGGPQLYVETPLIESHYLSKLAGFRVYLKMENAQPTSSFKLRGISYLIKKVGWLVVFYVPSSVRSFRDGTPIYCPF